MDGIAGLLQSCVPCLGTQLQRALSAIQQRGKMPGGFISYFLCLLLIKLLHTDISACKQRMKATHHHLPYCPDVTTRERPFWNTKSRKMRWRESLQLFVSCSYPFSAFSTSHLGPVLPQLVIVLCSCASCQPFQLQGRSRRSRLPMSYRTQRSR